jgi:hypothetical protein
VEPPEEEVADPVRSLEVRWILPGPLGTATADWFGRFPAAVESRADSYLLNPDLAGLSVKLRGTGALEVKAYRGSPGILDAAGGVRGRLEFFEKWSFPSGTPAADSGDPAGWLLVRKRINHFWLARGQIHTRRPPPGELRCGVELTEVGAGGKAWWTLGFEAAGPVGLGRGELDAAAALVFAHALPAGVALSTENSTSYRQWLRRPPDAGSEAGT